MQDKIKKALRENFHLNEKEEGSEESSESKSGRYERINGLLNNNVFNHAGIIEKLWGEANATKRSLFRKKLKRMENSEGGTYEFSDDELSRIISILMDTSKDIKKAVGRSGNE